MKVTLQKRKTSWAGSESLWGNEVWNTTACIFMMLQFLILIAYVAGPNLQFWCNKGGVCAQVKWCWGRGRGTCPWTSPRFKSFSFKSVPMPAISDCFHLHHQAGGWDPIGCSLHGWWSHLAWQWSPTMTGLWWLSHQCTLWGLAVCCFLE